MNRAWRSAKHLPRDHEHCLVLGIKNGRQCMSIALFEYIPFGGFFHTAIKVGSYSIVQEIDSEPDCRYKIKELTNMSDNLISQMLADKCAIEAEFSKLIQEFEMKYPDIKVGYDSIDRNHLHMGYDKFKVNASIQLYA